MLLLVALLLQFLTLGTQVAPAHALKFNITDVQQCDPIIISFSGTNTTFRPPKALSIIPVNGSSFSVPLPDPSVISTGIALTFLPFPAGTNFVASLDGASGESVIFVSDLLRVLPSPNGNSSCVTSPTGISSQPRNFQLLSPVAQCEQITISYNTSAVTQAPNVRLYQPKGFSIPLKVLSDDKTSGRATYQFRYFRGTRVLLLIEDSNGQNIRETTSLLMVQGDAQSDSSCLKDLFDPNGSGSSPAPSGTSTNQEIRPVLSKALIIGIAAGGTAVLLVSICMMVFIARDRRRRRSRRLSFDPAQMEKPLRNDTLSPTPSRLPGPALSSAGMVSNPIYTSEPFGSPTKSTVMKRGSMASWAQVVPDDQRYPGSPSSVLSSPTRIRAMSPRSDDNVSLQSLDIEGMLNMATLQSETYSRKNSSATILGPDGVPAPILRPPGTAYMGSQRLSPGTRHMRGPSDVPAGPDSMAFSRYSAESRYSRYSNDPFTGDRTSVTGSVLNEPVYGGVAGLPASPRISPRTSPRYGQSGGRAVNSGISGRSSSDWYGIAR